MEQIRSFIAIELPPGLKLEIGQLQAKLKSGLPSSMKWVNPESIHLTLKFLGNITDNQITEITGAIADAARSVSPFRLEVKGLGVFPNLNRVQVIWTGLKGDTTRLEQLQRRLEANLDGLGFTPEARPFTSHLTLARVRQQTTPEERQRLGQLMAETVFEAAHPIDVAAISLMKSQLTRAGAIYSRLGLIKLNLLPSASA